jgi:hypothetical protein
LITKFGSLNIYTVIPGNYAAKGGRGGRGRAMLNTAFSWLNISFTKVDCVLKSINFFTFTKTKKNIYTMTITNYLNDEQICGLLDQTHFYYIVC